MIFQEEQYDSLTNIYIGRKCNNIQFQTDLTWDMTVDDR